MLTFNKTHCLSSFLRFHQVILIPSLAYGFDKRTTYIPIIEFLIEGQMLYLVVRVITQDLLVTELTCPVRFGAMADLRSKFTCGHVEVFTHDK